MSSPGPETGSVEDMAPAPADAGQRAEGERLSLATVLTALIRRELWEHRQLWLAPLVVAVLLVICALPSNLGPINVDLTGLPGHFSWGAHQGLAGELPGELRTAIFGLGHWLLSLPLYLTMVLVLSFYLGDCLYAERKDRSILFWKSLPVSDLTTVGSKALVGMVLVPLGVFVLALVTDLLFSGIWHLRAYLGAPSALLMPWDTVTWLKVQCLMLIGVIVSILWYAPMGAYLLLTSAWARRSPFLWAILPPILAPLAERLAFGTDYLRNLLAYRSFGMMEIPAVQEAFASSRYALGSPHIIVLSKVFDHLDLAGVFGNVDLWLGVLVAVVFVLLTARIRRYRDES